MVKMNAMMRKKVFRTVLEVPEQHEKIGLADTLLSMGSCFSEHIGGRLADLKLNIQVNPFGILYHPATVFQALKRIQQKELVKKEELVFRDGLWHSWDHHGQFSHPDRDRCLANLNQELEKAHQHLQQATWLILTLGTARAYVLKEENRLVGNCHKFPGSAFERTLFPVDKMVNLMVDGLEALSNEKEDFRVILTVSPVRHLRDGFIENQESKASLILACRELVRRLSYVSYFPAYELLLDDLRDYRFYEADGTHPNNEAVEYIWDNFIHSYFLDEDRQTLGGISQFIRKLQHRPLHPTSQPHYLFLQRTWRELEEMGKKYPGLNFSKERTDLKKRLSKFE